MIHKRVLWVGGVWLASFLIGIWVGTVAEMTGSDYGGGVAYTDTTVVYDSVTVEIPRMVDVFDTTYIEVETHIAGEAEVIIPAGTVVGEEPLEVRFRLDVDEHAMLEQGRSEHREETVQVTQVSEERRGIQFSAAGSGSGDDGWLYAGGGLRSMISFDELKWQPYVHVRAEILDLWGVQVEANVDWEPQGIVTAGAGLLVEVW